MPACLDLQETVKLSVPEGIVTYEVGYNLELTGDMSVCKFWFYVVDWLDHPGWFPGQMVTYSGIAQLNYRYT